jgi:hypothetical protein
VAKAPATTKPSKSATSKRVTSRQSAPTRGGHAALAAKIAATTTASIKLTRRQIANFVEDFPDELLDIPPHVSQCHLCKTVAADRELRRYFNRAKLMQRPNPEIVTQLAQRGIATSDGKISTHYTKHVLPFILPAIRQRAVSSMTVRALRDLGEDASLPELAGRAVMLAIQPLIDSLADPPTTAELLALPALKRTAFVLDVAKALGHIQATYAGTKMREMDLTFKQIRLGQTNKRGRDQALTELREFMQASYPDVWDGLQDVLAAFTKHAAPVPSLPAGEVGP